MRLCLAVLMAASALIAQPKFDVVSIRPTRSPIRLTSSPYLPGGHFNDPGTILLFLIPMAYDIPLPDRQLLGIPEWAKRTAYLIEAKAGADLPALSPAENETQIKLMLREMLADRFKLRIHTETRQESLLNMTVDKGGLKVSEVAAPVPPETAGDVSVAMRDDRGGISGKKVTMARLATTVSLYLKQDVIDQTGLTGYYDLAIRWTAHKVEGAPPPSVTLGQDGIAMFYSALREELGLRFIPGKGPVQYWVIDSIEPPTEN
ncbi:MAG: TIGR03435 family protein [Bryobacteraceae bacterium]